LLSRRAPAYAYEFDDADGGPLGATHAAELRCRFDLSFDRGPAGGPGDLPAPGHALALVRRAYWTAFAWAGSPSAAPAPAWRPFADERLQRLRPRSPGDEPAADYAVRHECAFWT
jgi:carboxylesterase type B